jgi:hypothetical protein
MVVAHRYRASTRSMIAPPGLAIPGTALRPPARLFVLRNRVQCSGPLSSYQPLSLVRIEINRPVRLFVSHSRVQSQFPSLYGPTVLKSPVVSRPATRQFSVRTRFQKQLPSLYRSLTLTPVETNRPVRLFISHSRPQTQLPVPSIYRVLPLVPVETNRPVRLFVSHSRPQTQLPVLYGPAVLKPPAVSRPAVRLFSVRTRGQSQLPSLYRALALTPREIYRSARLFIGHSRPQTQYPALYGPTVLKPPAVGRSATRQFSIRTRSPGQLPSLYQPLPVRPVISKPRIPFFSIRTRTQGQIGPKPVYVYSALPLATPVVSRAVRLFVWRDRRQTELPSRYQPLAARPIMSKPRISSFGVRTRPQGQLPSLFGPLPARPVMSKPRVSSFSVRGRVQSSLPTPPAAFYSVLPLAPFAKRLIRQGLARRNTPAGAVPTMLSVKHQPRLKIAVSSSRGRLRSLRSGTQLLAGSRNPSRGAQPPRSHSSQVVTKPITLSQQAVVPVQVRGWKPLVFFRRTLSRVWPFLPFQASQPTPAVTVPGIFDVRPQLQGQVDVGVMINGVVDVQVEVINALDIRVTITSSIDAQPVVVQNIDLTGEPT